MKRILSLLLTNFVVAAILAQPLPSQDLQGDWNGKLSLPNGASLTLVLHIATDEAGQPVCTLDSPDQGAKGMPMTVGHLSADSVSVNLPMLGAAYQARLIDDVLHGTFMQMGQRFPLDLKRGADNVRRPQHPQPPYAYRTEEVTFTNVADGAQLAGTLTYPVKSAKRTRHTPVVLLVSGSGLQNRDEELFDHKPFLVIADAFAKAGIASLRYDDRTFGQSVGGDALHATTQDFARDAAAGVEFLRQHGEFDRVGVLGHSEGAAIAFMLGASKSVDFVISMAGIGAKGDVVLAAQMNRAIELQGGHPTATVETIRSSVAKMATPWMQWFIDYDPVRDIAATRCPVMAMNGDKDSQVIASQNLPLIKANLSRNKKNIVREYADLNHLFQHCTTGSATEYRAIEETISPEVLHDICEWILSL